MVAVDAGTDTLTVQQRQPVAWGPLLASTPIFFGPSAAQYGLQPDTPYYLVDDGTTTDNGATYSFQVSAIWQQDLSQNVPGANGAEGAVPIQGVNGNPGDPVDLANPGGDVNLKWGPIQPVSQLGSQQLTSNSLVRNPDRSVTFWIGPKLPAGAPASNWLPTPSKAYYESIYPASKAPDGSDRDPTADPDLLPGARATSRPRSCRRRAESWARRTCSRSSGGPLTEVRAGSPAPCGAPGRRARRVTPSRRAGRGRGSRRPRR